MFFCLPGVFSLLPLPTGVVPPLSSIRCFPPSPQANCRFLPHLFLSCLLFPLISKILAEFCKLNLFLIHFFLSPSAPVFTFCRFSALTSFLFSVFSAFLPGAGAAAHIRFSAPPPHPSPPFPTGAPPASFRPVPAEFFPFSPVCSYRVHISLLYCMFRKDH